MTPTQVLSAVTHLLLIVMFNDNTRWHPLLSPCGQSCAEFRPLIKVTVWVLVGVGCNYSQLIIENLAFSGESKSDWPRPPAQMAPHFLLRWQRTLFTAPHEISCVSQQCPTWFYAEHCVPFLRFFIKRAPALRFGVTCLLNSLQQRFLISLVTHWIVDLWVCMRRGWISCNYRELWR